MKIKALPKTLEWELAEHIYKVHNTQEDGSCFPFKQCFPMFQQNYLKNATKAIEFLKAKGLLK